MIDQEPAHQLAVEYNLSEDKVTVAELDNERIIIVTVDNVPAVGLPEYYANMPVHVSMTITNHITGRATTFTSVVHNNPPTDAPEPEPEPEPQP